MSHLPADFDPRLTPARPDLAAAHLQGIIEAPLYAAGTKQRVIDAHAPVRREPNAAEPLVTQLLHGEIFTVYESTIEGWSWGQAAADLYVGWVPSAALGPATHPSTHRVQALRTPVFPGPSIKLPPVDLLSLGSHIRVKQEDRRFATTDEGLHIFASHLAPLDRHEDDFVEVATRYLGAAYLWGGRSSLGLDCSGLVQMTLTATGVPCPRDSDMQEKTLGRPVDFSGDIATLRRGDLLFWPGHVGIVENEATLLHATAYFMSVVREPLAGALARIEAAGDRLRSVKRL